MNKKAELAWNLYISIENHLVAISILNFIAHEFYRMGDYYFSFKSFLFLEKFSPSLENSNGKLASAAGLFYLVMAIKEPAEKLQEVIHYLSEFAVSSSFQSEEVARMIKTFLRWGKENGKNFSDKSVYEEGY